MEKQEAKIKVGVRSVAIGQYPQLALGQDRKAVSPRPLRGLEAGGCAQETGETHLLLPVNIEGSLGLQQSYEEMFMKVLRLFIMARPCV